MQLAPNRIAEPRLLTSVEPDETALTEAASPSPRVAAKQAGIFSRNRRLVYAGAIGVLSFLIVGFFLWQSERKDGEQSVFRTFTRATTRSLAASPHSAETPPPIVVQLSTDMVRVTAIALGHPRLAIVNGRAVAEGDVFVVHGPTRSVTLTLRVMKISDGQIDFSDGAKIFAARLTVPAPAETTSR